MASNDHLTRLRNMRDSAEKELENEFARRLALTNAGNPAPTSYSAGGRSMSWNDYVATMRREIKEMNDYLLASGAEVGGIPEAIVQLWT